MIVLWDILNFCAGVEHGSVEMLWREWQPKFPILRMERCLEIVFVLLSMSWREWQTCWRGRLVMLLASLMRKMGSMGQDIWEIINTIIQVVTSYVDCMLINKTQNNIAFIL